MRYTLPKKAQSENMSTSEEVEKKEKQEDHLGEKSSDVTKGRGAFWISSGSDLMDLVVGGGRGLGYETGMSVLFEAQSSAGKSFLAHEIVASAYHKYKSKANWMYLDCESGCTFDSKALYGVEIMPPNVEDRKRPKTIEAAFSEIMLFGEAIKKDEFGIVIVDSLDGLVSEAAEERASKRVLAYSKGKEFDEASYGMEKAKYLSQEFWPNVNEMCERKNVLLIVVSQYRQAQGQYGSVNKISNGEANKFYSHARVKFVKKEELEVKGRSIGAIVDAGTIKMKGPWPYRNCYIVMHYSRGIDNTATNIDYLYDLRTAERGELKKRASEQLLTWDDKELSRSDLINYIEDNNLEKKLSERVREKWYNDEEVAVEGLKGRKSRYA